MNPRGWTLIVLVAASGAALAKKPKEEAQQAVKEAADKGPATSAAEIPALAALLDKAGWQPTPELSGVFKPGSIFQKTAMGDQVLAKGCFSAQPEESTYTATEIVTSLQAGVSVGAGLANANAYAGIVKKVKFGTPTQESIPTLDLELSNSCLEKLKKLPSSQISSSYVVKEVLKAEISEQTCGKVDAGGRFVGLGAADAEYAAACAQASLEPVAVGYRTVALADLMGLSEAPVAVGYRAAPELNPLADQPVGGAVVEAPAASTGGGGRSGEKARKQACEVTAASYAMTFRTQALEQAAADAQTKATAAWEELATQTEGCVGKDKDKRGLCAAVVEDWIRYAEGLSVRLPAEEVESPTACGAVRVPMKAMEESVSTPALAQARSMLIRLDKGTDRAPSNGPSAIQPVVLRKVGGRIFCLEAMGQTPYCFKVNRSAARAGLPDLSQRLGELQCSDGARVTAELQKWRRWRLGAFVLLPTVYGTPVAVVPAWMARRDRAAAQGALAGCGVGG